MILFLLISTFILFSVQSYYIIFLAPIEVTQGIIQKIFYYHVPTAWVSFIAFTSVLIYSFLYLSKKNILYYYKSFSHTLTGWLLTSGVLVTGPLWAKPVWGTFWNWADERLVTFFILWLSYTVYLILNVMLKSLEQKALFSSILGIISFVNIPIVYLSIRIWKTPSHPGPIVGGDSENSITTEMHLLIWLSVLSFLSIYLLLSQLIYRYQKQQEQVRKKLFT